MLLHDRREFLKLSGLAGVVFASGLFPGRPSLAQAPDFHFIQFSDSHWGYKGSANPDAAHTLEKAVAKVNGLAQQPDFIVFTGDLTHTTEDAAERRARMKKFREIVSALHVKDVRFMPGEHDASLDNGAVYKEFFGAPHYTFDHKGVHFIALDNVSDPAAKLGDEQLAWLADDLKAVSDSTPIVVFAHIPLWAVYLEWGWGTDDAAQALAMLKRFGSVTVLNGHIHQIMQKVEGNVTFHTARSTAFPQPAPGTAASPGPMTVPAGQLRGLLGTSSVMVKQGGQELAIIDSTLA
mgnify:CR=1 FL=1